MTSVLAQLARQGAVIERLSSDSRRVAPRRGLLRLAGRGGRRPAPHRAGDRARRAARALGKRRLRLGRAAGACRTRRCKDLKSQAGVLAHEFYGRPSESLWVCGVTGTNGKTSCSPVARAALLSGRNEKAAVLGTLGAGFSRSAANRSTNTTPDALELHRAAQDVQATRGARAVAMEVSSHGLDQGRVNGVAFDCALFTNLTHDHLDYHGTMEAYARGQGAPVRRARPRGRGAQPGRCVRRAARAAAREAAACASSATACRTPCAGASSAADEGDRVAHQAAASWGTARIALPPARDSSTSSNALGVLGCLLAYGHPVRRRRARCSSSCRRFPGACSRSRSGRDGRSWWSTTRTRPTRSTRCCRRCEPVARARGGRLVVVFGAGGERDRRKRAADGRGGLAARRPHRAHLRQSARRGPARRSSRRSGAASPARCAVEPDRARGDRSGDRRGRRGRRGADRGQGPRALRRRSPGGAMPFSDAGGGRRGARPQGGQR